MATKYQMQAKSSADAKLYPWLADAPDFAGAGWSAAGRPGTPLDIALVGGGYETTGGSGGGAPDGAFVFDDGSYVVFDDGSYVVTS